MNHFLLMHFSIILLLSFLHPDSSEIGSSAHYGPPFLPTACYGYDTSKLPSDGLFGAAGDGIWQNGVSCGRKYLVKCISGNEPAGDCVSDEVIEVTVVDYAITSVSRPSNEGSTIVLSSTAFGLIANSTAADTIRIQLKETCLTNKKRILRKFQKSDLSFEMKLKAEFESWSPKIKDTNVKFTTDMWSVSFGVEVGLFNLFVKAKFPSYL